MKSYFVYILASKRNGTLYVGVTNNLRRRMWEHKNGLAEGFTRAWGVGRLVYFERFDHVDCAIRREKQLKKWRRRWKLELIEKDNAGWEDLAERF
nr:GIY-YIG nuclease family protein [Anaerohalosphaera lusitana]